MGQTCGGERLVEGVERADEEPGLLTGRDEETRVARQLLEPRPRPLPAWCEGIGKRLPARRRCALADLPGEVEVGIWLLGGAGFVESTGL